MLKMLAMLFFPFVVSLVATAAEKTMSMNFKQKEVHEIIEIYSKTSGERFIVDPDVRGKISILVEEKVDLPEAFHLLSSALAVRGYAILKKEGFFLVRNTRSAQKDLVETSETLPDSTKPERLFTWVVRPQVIRVDSFEKNLRNLISRDGDFFIDSGQNQIVLTDYISTLQRIKKVLAAVDKKVN